MRGGEWPQISTGRRNKADWRADGGVAHTYVRKIKGGDWGFKLDGVFGKRIRPVVLWGWGGWVGGGSLSAHPRATNYNSHVAHST